MYVPTLNCDYSCNNIIVCTYIQKEILTNILNEIAWLIILLIINAFNRKILTDNDEILYTCCQE